MKKTFSSIVMASVAASVLCSAPAASAAEASTPVFEPEKVISSSYATKVGRNTASGFQNEGNRITDMSFDRNGLLTVGYGDWDSNIDSYGVGPIVAEKIDINTDQVISSTPVYTEAMAQVKNLNGDLFIPMTDPSARIGPNNPTGTWTDAGGKMRILGTESSMIHVFDVERVGNSIYQSGSVYSSTPGNGNGAIMKGSLDGTSAAKTILKLGDNPWSRIYDIAVSSDEKTIYFSGSNLDAQGWGGTAKYDVETGKLTKISNISSTSYMVDGHVLTMFNDGRNYLVDMETGQKINLFPDGNSREPFHWLQQNYDGSLTFSEPVWNFSNGTVTYEIYQMKSIESGFTKVAQIPASGSNPYSSLEIAPDGRIILGDNYGNINVFKKHQPRFTDVVESSDLGKDVINIEDTGALDQYGATLNPQQSIIREEIVKSLYAMKGSETSYTTRLRDVSKTDPDYKAFMWAIENRLVLPLGMNFSGSKDVLRSEIFDMVYAASGETFVVTDEVKSKYGSVTYKPSIYWALENGLVPSHYINNFNTPMKVTREEMVQILSDFHNMTAH